MVPPRSGQPLNKNPLVMHQGEKASLTLSGTAETCDTLCLDNGGNSGGGYLTFGLSPCNSEVHSALRCGQVFTFPCSLNRPGERVLVLFNVIII